MMNNLKIFDVGNIVVKKDGADFYINDIRHYNNEVRYYNTDINAFVLNSDIDLKASHENIRTEEKQYKEKEAMLQTLLMVGNMCPSSYGMKDAFNIEDSCMDNSSTINCEQCWINGLKEYLKMRGGIK